MREKPLNIEETKKGVKTAIDLFFKDFEKEMLPTVPDDLKIDVESDLCNALLVVLLGGKGQEIMKEVNNPMTKFLREIVCVTVKAKLSYFIVEAFEEILKDREETPPSKVVEDNLRDLS